MKKGLIKKVKDSFAYQELARAGRVLINSPKHLYTTLALTSFLTACGDSVGPEPPPEVDNPPTIVNANISPRSGMAPLPVNLEMLCEDDKGISNYKIVKGTDTTLINTSVLNEERTLMENGRFSMGCTDTEGQTEWYGPININVTQPPPPPPPVGSVSQTFTLEDYVNGKLSITFTNVPEATSKILHNDTLVRTKTITTSPYNETLEKRLIGDWMSIVEAPGVKPDTARFNVPTYTVGTPDLSQITFSLKEGDSTQLYLSRAVSFNPEKNPVKYLFVNNPEGNLNATIGAFPEDTVVTLRALDDVAGPSSLEFGFEGNNTELATVQGDIIDLPRLIGRVESTITKTGTYSQIRVFDVADTLTSVYEGFTDSQGNFDIRLNEPHSEIYAQARLETGSLPDSNFARTIRIPGRDTSGVLIRAHPWNGIENFKQHLQEVNPSLLKLYPQGVEGIEIIDVDPLGRGSFSLAFQNLIKVKSLNPLDMGCYFLGNQQANSPYVQIDSATTPDFDKHYSIVPYGDGFRILPDSNWIIYTSNINSLSSVDRIDNSRYVVELRFEKEETAAHETGHTVLGPDHSITLDPVTQTDMNGTGGLSRTTPGPADCEARYIVAEETYTTGTSYDMLLGRFFNQQQQ